MNCFDELCLFGLRFKCAQRVVHRMRDVVEDQSLGNEAVDECCPGESNDGRHSDQWTVGNGAWREQEWS